MFNFDQFVFSIIPNLDSGFITKGFAVASFLFDPIPFIFLCALTFIFLKNKLPKESFLFLITMIFSVVLVWVLKEILNVPRPPHGFYVFGPSFPSAHSALATSYFLFILHISKTDKKYYRRWIHFLFCILFPVFVGVSRLYFGVHWLSDVLFGYILGGLVFYVSIKFFKKYNYAVK